jgi:NADPH:quinone reductase-like Zn-dependent oxidoreductase
MHTAERTFPIAPPAPAVVARTMRAVLHPRYGEPEVLALGEIARPTPGPGEVLVRAHAAGVSIGDHHVVTGKPYLIRLTPYGGLPRPKHRVPGMALAGRVEEVGAGVTAFRPGDEVFGDAPTGAFAEYVVVPVERLVAKPSNLSFEEAAATPWAVAALQGLRDAGGLRAGQRVLIYGASGGVGTWAVQIAKALGAVVTAVCSTRNVEMVRGLGADEVIDYTEQDFAAGGARFDLMLDLVGNRSLKECKRVLTPEGTYVACSGGGGDWVGPIFRLIGLFVTSWFSSQRLTTFVAEPNGDDLRALAEIVQAGKAKPVIERRFALSEAGEALRHVGEGHSRGQSVIVIAE